MSLLDKIKGRLRTFNDDAVFNADLMDDINAAKAEMLRLNINPVMVEDEDDPAILRAIKTFVLANQTEDGNLSEKYMDSFKYQVDCMRKSEMYRG